MRIVPPGEGRIEGVRVVETETGDAPVAGFELHQHFRQPGVARRSRNQADMRRFVEDLLAFLLRHAADHGKYLALPGFAFELLKAVEDFLLGLIANAAGVVENVVRGLGRIYLGIALMKQRPDHLLGIVRIHLAAECFDEKSFVH